MDLSDRQLSPTTAESRCAPVSLARPRMSHSDPNVSECDLSDSPSLRPRGTSNNTVASTGQLLPVETDMDTTLSTRPPYLDKLGKAVPPRLFISTGLAKRKARGNEANTPTSPHSSHESILSATPASAEVLCPIRDYLDSLQLYLLSKGPGPNDPKPDAQPSQSYHDAADELLSPISPFHTWRAAFPVRAPPKYPAIHTFLFILFQIVTVRYPHLTPGPGPQPSHEATKNRSGYWSSSIHQPTHVSRPIFIRLLSLVQIAVLIGITFWAGLADLKANPLIGPNFGTFLTFGAPVPSTLKNNFQVESWKLLVPPFLHGGVAHLVSNLSWQLSTGVTLERAWGSWRVAFVFFTSALFGTLCSVQVRSYDVVIIGSSGGVCGLMGATFADHLLNHSVILHPKSQLRFWLFGVAFMLGLGLLPIMDNITHVSGLVAGFAAGLVAIPDLTLDVAQHESKLQWRLLGLGMSILLIGGVMYTLTQHMPWECGLMHGRMWCCWLFVSLSC